MKNDESNIDHLSVLANLPLTQKEKASYATQFTDILSYVKSILQLDLKNTPPTNQVTGKFNELRNDVVTPSFSQEEALSQASNTYHGYFIVPGIFQDES